VYAKPVHYAEVVNITTGLLKVTPDMLHVEMYMTDKNNTTLKALLWTTFIPVNVKTGKKETHAIEIMEALQNLQRTDVQHCSNMDERVCALITELKQ
jgi:acyl-CoA thioester hydrolase